MGKRLRITGLAAPLQTLLLSALPKAAAFSVTEPPAAMASPAAPIGQPVSVEMLVALAASESPVDRRRRGAAQADRAITALERFNAELLAGVPAVERLRDVADWLQSEQHEQDDAALASLFNDIELRMRVELAKYDVSA